MKYEVKKLFASRYILLLLICLFVLNGILFYRYCTQSTDGYTLAQMKEKYAMAENLSAEIEALEEQYRSGSYEESSLLTGDVLAELRLDRAVLEQISNNLAYPEYLQNRIFEIQTLQNLGFSGTKESYLYRAQEAVKLKCQALVGLTLPAEFSGGVSVFAQWYVSDLLLFVYLLVGGLLLFTQEGADGMLMLLRPTAGGKGRLYLRKLLTMLLLAVASCLLFYGTNLLLSASLLGLGDLSRGLQSVPYFQGCALPLTVLGYLLQGLLDKLLWCCSVASVIVLLCIFAKRPAGAVSLCAAAFGISLLLGSSDRLLLQNLSLTAQSSASERYREFLQINIFGMPVSEMTAFYLLCGVTFSVCCLSALAVFCRRDSIVAPKRRFSGLSLGRHTSLLRHEAYKLFVTQGGALVLAVLCLLQWGLLRSSPLTVTDGELYLRQYSAVLSGSPTPEKGAYLLEETRRLSELHGQIDAYYASCTDQNLAALLTKDLRLALEPENAFERAKAQYEALKPEQAYVHPTGYQQLFGRQGIANDLLSTVLMEAALTVVLSGCFSRERETGVVSLQTSAGASKRIFRRKLLLVTLLALAMAAISYLPQMLQIADTYGLPQWQALAGGLAVFSDFPASWHIWQVFAFTGAVRLSLVAVSIGFLLLISKKSPSTVTALLICTAALEFPPAIGFLLLQLG